MDIEDEILQDAIEELQAKYGYEDSDDDVEVDSEKVEYYDAVVDVDDGERVHQTLCGGYAVEEISDE